MAGMPAEKGNELDARKIVSIRVDATSYRDATERIIGWAEAGTPGYVCVANVHMTMEANDAPDFAEIVNGARLVVPDGMPLVWALKLLGVASATRVRGPDLTITIAEAAARRGLPLALYGGSPEVVERFADALRGRASGLDLSAVISPPYRQLSEEEEIAFADDLRRSGAKIVLVGLGCPKQERWMARNAHRVGAMMIGVGAAFDFHAGSMKEAPDWMQGLGLEWLHRLAQEPRRLWRRYLVHNPRFIMKFTRQWLSQKVTG